MRRCLKSPIKGRKRTELVQSTRAKKNTHTNRPTDLLKQTHENKSTTLKKNVDLNGFAQISIFSGLYIVWTNLVI